MIKPYKYYNLHTWWRNLWHLIKKIFLCNLQNVINDVWVVLELFLLESQLMNMQSGILKYNICDICFLSRRWLILYRRWETGFCKSFIVLWNRYNTQKNVTSCGTFLSLHSHFKSWQSRLDWSLDKVLIITLWAFALQITIKYCASRNKWKFIKFFAMYVKLFPNWYKWEKPDYYKRDRVLRCGQLIFPSGLWDVIYRSCNFNRSFFMFSRL